MSLLLLRQIRDYEVSLILPFVKRGAKLLEIGAGAGWQAKKLQEWGARVTAIDVPSSTYTDHRVFEVSEYDGRTIPFADQSFEIVFSSNVLEHIANLDGFLLEIRRVLVPGGLAIHILPSAGWRFWTNITHYIFYGKLLFAHLFPTFRASEAQRQSHLFNRQYTARELVSKAARVVLIPGRHGEHGNCFTEMYLFSRRRWLSEFTKAGWEIVDCLTNRCFYTGYFSLARYLNINARRTLSHVLGSAANIYVMKERDAQSVRSNENFSVARIERF